MKGPLVSVIILSFNRRDEMRECLQSVYAQDYPDFEIVMLDNASTDGSVEMLEAEFPSVRLIRLSENVGSSAGRCLALEKASGKYVLQIDNDATLSPPDAMRRMVKRFEAEDDLGVIFAKVVDPPTGRVYRPGYGDAHVEDEFYTWRFHGCIAMIRREAITKAGYYLPAEFFRAGEENDLATRVQDCDYNILYMPSIVAYHKLSPKARDKSEIIFLTVRNNIRVAWKFFPVGRALFLTLWRIPRYLVTRLAAGDATSLVRVFRIVAGIKDALVRRRPISRTALAVIDYLTLKPALDLDSMRAVRANPPKVSMLDLLRRRFRGTM